MFEIVGETVVLGNRMEWTIKDFFSQTHKGFWLESLGFRFEREMFYFRLREPNEERTYHPMIGWLDVFLIPMRQRDFSTYSVRFSIRKKSGEETESSIVHYGGNIHWAFCRDQFVQWDTLVEKKDELVPNGHLTIICRILEEGGMPAMKKSRLGGLSGVRDFDLNDGDYNRSAAGYSGSLPRLPRSMLFDDYRILMGGYGDLGGGRGAQGGLSGVGSFHRNDGDYNRSSAGYSGSLPRLPRSRPFDDYRSPTGGYGELGGGRSVQAATVQTNQSSQHAPANSQAAYAAPGLPFNAGNGSANINPVIQRSQDVAAPHAFHTEDVREPQNYQLLCFHAIHGKSVTLSNNRSSVSRKQGMYSLAYAFTECPIEIGKTVIMSVKQTDHSREGPLIYGITSCDPSTIKPHELPENAEDLFDRLEYWIVKQKQYRFEVGHHITFTINNQGEVEVAVNGESDPVFYVDHTQPLWLFVNLTKSISELQLSSGLSGVGDFDLNDGDYNRSSAGYSGSLPRSRPFDDYDSPVRGYGDLGRGVQGGLSGVGDFDLNDGYRNRPPAGYSGSLPRLPPQRPMSYYLKSLFSYGSEGDGFQANFRFDSDQDFNEGEHSELRNHKTLKNFSRKIVNRVLNEIMDISPNIGWSDIAGLDFVKTTVQEIVIWPLLRPDIFTGLRAPPRGILLFGPPGTGKTMIGKCIATESKSTFFCISASSLTSKWAGESEQTVRALFAAARLNQPAVIFIDEIDSLLSQRNEDDRDHTRKLKTELLVQFDGAKTVSEERILVVGATNRPHELDEAARRRFAKRLYVPLPNESARRQIIEKLLVAHQHNLSDADLQKIGDETDGYSGSDVTNLCKEAAMGPIRCIGRENMKTVSLDQVRPIALCDFTDALRQVRASVVADDLNYYIEWNKKFGSFEIQS